MQRLQGESRSTLIIGKKKISLRSGVRITRSRQLTFYQLNVESTVRYLLSVLSEHVIFWKGATFICMYHIKVFIKAGYRAIEPKFPI